MCNGLGFVQTWLRRMIPPLLHMTTLATVIQCMKPLFAGWNIYPYGAWLRSRDGSFEFRNGSIHCWHAPTANPMQHIPVRTCWRICGVNRRTGADLKCRIPHTSAPPAQTRYCSCRDSHFRITRRRNQTTKNKTE